MMPSFPIGLGCGVQDGPSYEILDRALKGGIRFFDTSTLYSMGALNQLNECLKSNHLQRQDVHICLKLWITAFEKNRQFDHETFNFRLRENVQNYIQDLNLDYLDSLVIHWPLKVDSEGFPEEFIIEEIWPQLELLLNAKTVNSIGVSNFNIIELQRLLAIAKIKPHSNQIEFSPLAHNIELKNFCQRNSIQVIGHSPFNFGWKDHSPSLLKDEAIKEIAYKHQRSPAQIILAWVCSHGVMPIPGTKNLQHLEEIIEVPEIHLDEEDIQCINGLNQNAYCYSDLGEYFGQSHYLQFNNPNIEARILDENGNFSSTYLYDNDFVENIKNALTHGAGFVILPEIFKELNTRLIPELEAKQAQVLGRWDGFGIHTKDSLLNSGEAILKLIDDPLISLLTQSLLGWDCKLDNLAASTSRVAPNNYSLGPHQDSPFEQNPGCPLPPPEYPLVLQTIIALDAFTEDNGPLYVIPGSHRKRMRVNLPWSGNLPKGPVPQDALKVIVPAGSAILAVGHIWHGAASNTSNKPRRGFLLEYVSSVCEPRERFTTENVSDDVLKICSRRLLRLISDGKRFFYDRPSLLINYKELLKDKIPDYAKGPKVPQKLETVIYTAHTHTTGGRGGSSSSDDKLFSTALDLPQSMGGNGKAPNPEQLLGAGFSASFLTTLQQLAGQKLIALPDNLSIDSSVSLGQTSQGLGLAVSLKIKISDIEANMAKDLIAEAKTKCPYCNAVKDNIPVEIILI
jgi:Ohr subfamily peroxiredoxin